MSLYRDFATQEEIDAHYNVLGNVSDPDAIIRGWVERGEAAVAQLDCRLQVPYGPTLRRACDVFPAGPGRAAATLLSSMGATGAGSRPAIMCSWPRPLVEAGLATFVVNYELCPTAHDRRDRAAGSGRQIVWAFRPREPSLGADPSRLTISGHSAGGHLVGDGDWRPTGRRLRTARRPDQGRGRDQRCLRSRGSFRTAMSSPRSRRPGTEVLRLSPIRHLPRTAPPLLVAVGGDETDEFRRQSRDFLAAWKSAGHDGQLARARRQAPPDRARGARAARERSVPCAGRDRACRLVDLVGFGHRRLEPVDREVGLARGSQERCLAPCAQIDRHAAPPPERRPGPPPPRGGRRAAGRPAGPACRVPRPPGRHPRHAPRRGSAPPSRRGAGSRLQSGRGRGSSRW